MMTGDLFTGMLESDCLLPCLRTSATVERGTTTKQLGRSFVSLSLNSEVRYTRTSVDSFSFVESLNFLGSNLGLWPGLGLYQVLEWMTGLVVGGGALHTLARSCRSRRGRQA